MTQMRTEGFNLNVAVYDNGGQTFDRYTAVFPDGHALAIGPTGNVPNGVCMSVELHSALSVHDRVNFQELPVAVRVAIRQFWDEWYRD